VVAEEIRLDRNDDNVADLLTVRARRERSQQDLQPPLS